LKEKERKEPKERKRTLIKKYKNVMFKPRLKFDKVFSFLFFFVTFFFSFLFYKKEKRKRK